MSNRVNQLKFFEFRMLKLGHVEFRSEILKILHVSFYLSFPYHFLVSLTQSEAF